MNQKYPAHPFNQKTKFWQIPLNIGSKQNYCPKITLLSSRQTKNQQDKLQIRSKRLTTKQSQIKQLKSLKILPFPLLLSLCSLHLSVSHSFSDILSTVLNCSSKLPLPGLPLSTAQASFLRLSHSFSESNSLLSASLNCSPYQV